MREASVTEEDCPSGVTPVAPWRVAALAIPEYGVLSVRFMDGLEGRVEVLPSFMRGVFEALQDPEIFAQARVVQGVVTWPSGIDLAPDAMYDDIVENGHHIVA